MKPQRFEAATLPAPFVRNDATWASYFLLALLTFFYGSIGPLMPSLRADLDLTFAQGSLHSVTMAAGMSLIGTVSDKIARALGRRQCLVVSMAGLSAGLMLMCAAPHFLISLLGAFIVGCSGALTLVIAPTVLAERFGARVGLAYGEANVVAYLGMFIVPATVSLAVSTVGWRWSFVPPVLAILLFWTAFRRANFGTPPVRDRSAAIAPLGVAYWCFWTLLMLSVSAETCMLVWGPSYLETVMLLPREMALWSSMIFPVGVLVGRSLGVVLLHRFDSATLLFPTLALSLAGFLLFFLGANALVSMIGFFCTGVGMANLYPLGITLAVTSVRGAADSATARVSLASGLAVISAPFTIGALADRFGLGAAYGVIPLYLAAAAVVSLAGLNARRGR